MQLSTTIDIPKSSFQIAPDDKVTLIGSCFSDSIGEKLTQSGFDVTINPFGTLYNPESIANILLQTVKGNRYKADDDMVFMSTDGVWHSWMHHSKFSSHSCEELLEKINDTFEATRAALSSADVMIITFGTSVIYRLRENDMLVANCHKQPDSLFSRTRLDTTQICSLWDDVLDKLHTLNPQLKVIFTVSPIRHKRDGMHANNISKGILLQAVDDLTGTGLFHERHHHNNEISTQYFPSYEIMVDELRDYRFYAEDMVHPSPLAIEYIWERFQDTYFTNKTKEVVRLRHKEWVRSQHRQIVG